MSKLCVGEKCHTIGCVCRTCAVNQTCEYGLCVPNATDNCPDKVVVITSNVKSFVFPTNDLEFTPDEIDWSPDYVDWSA